jgi:SAM-dependent methyltransferase
MVEEGSRSLASMTTDEIGAAVAERYGMVARVPAQKHGFPVGRAFAESVGYAPSDLDSLPASCAESFTGAGNPQEFVGLREGDIVLDLGCGCGLDALLYARRVAPSGGVIGLDFAQPMVDQATRNARNAGLEHVRFVCAPASAIPLPDASVDVVTANGILNLSPDRDAIVRDVVRVLRPGGRMTFAEITLREERVIDARETLDDWFRCIGGAESGEALKRRLERAGLTNPEILDMRRNARTNHPATICSVVTAQKPE